MQGYGRAYDDRYEAGHDWGGRGPRRGFRSAQRRYGYDFRGGSPRAGYGGYRDYPDRWSTAPDLRGWSPGGYDQDYAGRTFRPHPAHGRGHGGRYRSAVSDVDSVRAADIMTHNPETVTPDTPVLQVARRMRDLDVGVIPVVDDADSNRLQGMVTDRDIAIRAAAEGKDVSKTSVGEIMSTRPQTVSENDHVRDVFTIMKRARVRRVPVTDVQGRLVGIIAQADLAVNYAGLDLQRETEVEEVIEKISEPARPRWGREDAPTQRRNGILRRFRPEMEVELPDRVRAGWRTLRREARELMGRGYDHGWR